MRRSLCALTGCLAVFCLSCPLQAGALTPEGTAKGVRAKSVKGSQPVLGVKTPGVQIPFTSLTAEAQVPVPVKPQWAYFSNSLFVPASEGLQRIDAKTNKAEPIAGVAQPCGGMTFGFGSLWTPTCSDHSLTRLDAKTYKVVKTMPIGAASIPGAIAASNDSIWMLSDQRTTLTRIDPDTNSVVAEVRLPAGCRSLAFGENALWLACPNENQVLRINPVTNLVEKRIEVGAKPQAVAVGEGAAWVLCAKEGKIDRIDAKTNKVVKTIELGVPMAEGSLAFAEGSLWAALQGFPLSRIDPQSDTLVQQFHGAGGGVIQASKGALWVTPVGAGEASLWRIDPKLVVATLPE